MYDDSEYLVLRINKGHRKGYPFDNFQEAFIKAIQVAEECAADEKFKDAQVLVGPWYDNEIDEEAVNITELKSDFFCVLEDREACFETCNTAWHICSGTYSNKCVRENLEDPEEGSIVPEDNVIIYDEFDVVDMVTDWRTLAVFLANDSCCGEFDADEVYKTLGIAKYRYLSENDE